MPLASRCKPGFNHGQTPCARIAHFSILLVLDLTKMYPGIRAPDEVLPRLDLGTVSCGG